MVDRKGRVLTFRELSFECLHGAGHMALWDTLGPLVRDANQRSNDPDYKPIAPGAGLRKYRRWRG